MKPNEKSVNGCFNQKVGTPYFALCFLGVVLSNLSWANDPHEDSLKESHAEVDKKDKRKALYLEHFSLEKLVSHTSKRGSAPNASKVVTPLPDKPASISKSQVPAESIQSSTLSDEGKVPENFKALAVHPQIREALELQWGQGIQKELKWEHVPQAASRFFNSIFNGKLGQKIKNQWKPEPSDRREELGNQFLSYLYKPLMPFVDLTTDLVSAGNSFQFAPCEWTSRIRVCAEDFPLVPAQHLYYIIDQGELHTAYSRSAEDYQAYGGHSLGQVICGDTPLVSGESASLAIERLKCMEEEYAQTANYSLLTYNCGGVLKDCLQSSGAGFNEFGNFGVGSFLSKRSASGDLSLTIAQEVCNGRIERLRRIILTLESGRDLSLSLNLLKQILQQHRPSKDFLLQMLVSASRAKNINNQNKLLQAFSEFSYGVSPSLYSSGYRAGKVTVNFSQIFQEYYELPSHRLLPIYHKDLSRIFTGISENELKWLTQVLPQVHQLWLDFNASQSSQSR